MDGRTPGDIGAVASHRSIKVSVCTAPAGNSI